MTGRVTVEYGASRFLWQEFHGGTDRLVLETRAAPVPDAGEVRVRVAYAGINPVDWQIAASASLAHSFGVQLPMGFGNDFSGTVDAVGDGVTRWEIGDRIFGGARAAAVADHIVIREDDPRVHATPVGISDLTAGVVDIAARTASAVVDALALSASDTLLVSAAAGGVGTMVTQLAVMTGARVIGTGSSASADDITALGAQPVEYGPGLAARVRRLAPEGVTAAADLFDTTTAETALELEVRPHRVVTIESEDPPAGTRPVNGSDAKPSAALDILDLIERGLIRLPVERVYPIEEFAPAIEHQRRRHTHGKIAISLRQADEEQS